MASGDKRIGTSGDSMPFGTEVLSVGPLLQADALIFPIYVPVGMGTIRVKKVRSVVNILIGTGNSVVTIKNKTTGMTGGTLTITAASAIAAKDSCDIVDDANAYVAEGDYIALDHDGGSDAGEATFFIEFERCQ